MLKQLADQLVINQKPSWAFEIKWSDRYFEQYGELKSLLQQVRLQFIPAAVYAYIVGHNTFEKKQQTIGL